MKRSKHNLSHHVLATGSMGKLIPIGCVEVLPGDSIQHVTGSLVRAMPLSTPPIHPVTSDIHHFFVPYRLVWDKWEDFITGGADGLGVPVSDFPVINLKDKTEAELEVLSYLGVPSTSYGNNVHVSALPLRAYNMIWNEYYRDQDLQAKNALATSSGSDGTTKLQISYRAWEKDYFTTARPWEQKGPDVTVALSGTLPVRGLGFDPGVTPTAGPLSVVETPSSSAPSGAATYDHYYSSDNSDIYVESVDGKPSVLADLADATGIDVNDLRLALAVQRYQEARARYGSRYTEYLAYLGVRSSDARLQRPEYLGGGSQPLSFSEVLSTTSGSAGQLYGHGISSGRTRAYRRFFEEHGVVISLYSALPRTIYANALHRMWLRRTKEDFWQRELEHIGQQVVQIQEVNFRSQAGNDDLFGFQDRYDEYRFCPSRLAGKFNFGAANALGMSDWHFARTDEPTSVIGSNLSQFSVAANPSKEPFQAGGPTDETLIIAAYHRIIARRLVSQRGNSFIF